MAKKRSRGEAVPGPGGGGEPRSDPKSEALVPPASLSPSVLAALAAIGALSGCLSLFLWMELVLLRSGGSAFCAGSGGGLDCSQVWNGGFASTVHRLTGLPVAAWGLVWSAAAFLLPLLALLRTSERRPVATLAAGTRWTAAAGAVGILVMIGASLAAGALCVGCLATDLLVASYAFLALRGAGRAFGLDSPASAAGLGRAASAGLAAFVLLLYPGLHTPKASGEAGRNAIVSSAVAGASVSSAASGASSSSAASTSAPAEAPRSSEPSSGPAPAPLASAAAGTGDASKDRALTELVAALDPPNRQTLADSLAIYRSSPARQLTPPRALVGSDLARVRITEFTDILCEHCASLQETLKTVREHVSPGSFSVDARQFPLDGRCNSLLQPDEKRGDVRCVGAKILICAEPSGKEPAVADALFAKQQGLTRDEALRIAGQFLPAKTLDACLDAPSTLAKLEADVHAASQFDSDGTPIVAVNGRKGTSFGPFLYAIVLTGGSPDHPAFEALPPGNPAAHLH